MDHVSSLLSQYWNLLYPGTPQSLLDNFLHSVDVYRSNVKNTGPETDWYKDAIVYSLYVDLFNHDFEGLIGKLDYIGSLGVNCIWLLPVLDSPMRDAGFDISDYYTVRQELAGNSTTDRTKVFDIFLAEAHKHGIRVIFDIAVNHISDQHPWFTEAAKSTTNPYRRFFIWSDDTEKYKDARIIFKGIEKSNWEKSGDQYYFHRFFNFQPDLNYKNPEVLFAMCRHLLYWQNRGIDGFRADAIPYIWKEEGTACENHPLTHIVVKFFRAILDYIRPGTLLLAEACQTPFKVVQYMGNGDECHAAYHFPLMPRIYKAIAMQNGKPVEDILGPGVTPGLPALGQWFTFLRCHDELSLELVYVTEEERKFIHESYCHNPKWDFRLGEGIAARLSELMQRNPGKILLAYSIMLTLPGTPVIYYGDEFGKLNDEDYYSEMIKLVGKDDTRFLSRGKIDWTLLETELKDPGSLSSLVFYPLRQMLTVRRHYKAFGRGTITFVDLPGTQPGNLLCFYRQYENEKLLVIHNMTGHKLPFNLPDGAFQGTELFDKPLTGEIEPLGFRWVLVNG
jgi:maltose alpha-D-glucosyltransferase/alpha-amylase